MSESFKIAIYSLNIRNKAVYDIEHTCEFNNRKPVNCELN